MDINQIMLSTCGRRTYDPYCFRQTFPPYCYLFPVIVYYRIISIITRRNVRLFVNPDTFFSSSIAKIYVYINFEMTNDFYLFIYSFIARRYRKSSTWNSWIKKNIGDSYLEGDFKQRSPLHKFSFRLCWRVIKKNNTGQSRSA